MPVSVFFVIFYLENIRILPVVNGRTVTRMFRTVFVQRFDTSLRVIAAMRFLMLFYDFQYIFFFFI